MKSLTGPLSGFLRDCNGASAAEYALIVGIIVVGITGATLAFGGVLASAFSDMADCVETAC